MSASTPWPAPAKLNLMLHVVGRRPDGYHELQTVFQFIDRCDWLDLSVRDDGRVLRQSDLPGVAPEQDLVVRAARLLQRHTACRRGADISVHKRLPLGGGLGGGSSDAATTLVALNHLWGTGLSEDELAELGLGLGADVPVFIRGRAAWAEGVGERLRFVDLPEPWYLVLVPPCQVSTAAVFNDPELTRNSPRTTIADFLAGASGNACEPVVRCRHPEVSDALEWLQQYQPARLTGTGACVFAAFETETAADALSRQVPARISAFVARGLNRSPLRGRIAVENPYWGVAKW
jgi:4-diphosphocytidyl-2-C-methyl-D-erythritol kinase